MVERGIDLIAKERIRQIEEEAWTDYHDDDHLNDELAWAAVCYASPDFIFKFDDQGYQVDPWPWSRIWDKRKSDTRVQQLVKAGAFIAAEIDRIQRKTYYKKAVSILVFNTEQEKVLTVTSDSDGSYYCPGGLVRERETYIEAAYRALEESTGIEAEEMVEINAGFLDSKLTPDSLSYSVFFIAKVGDQKPDNTVEGLGITWHTIEELITNSLYSKYYRSMFSKLNDIIKGLISEDIQDF